MGGGLKSSCFYTWYSLNEGTPHLKIVGNRLKKIFLDFAI